MTVKRTFSLDPEVDRFLSQHSNRSQVVNALIKRYMVEMEQNQMIEAYQSMHSTEALSSLKEWEETTIGDGLDEKQKR